MIARARSLRDLTELIRELETSRAMDAGRLEALETRDERRENAY